MHLHTLMWLSRAPRCLLASSPYATCRTGQRFLTLILITMLPLALFVSVTPASPSSSFLSPVAPHPSVEPPSPPALLETQTAPVDLEQIHPKLRPCYVTVEGGDCGETPYDPLHPDGLFCPPDFPLCILTFDVPLRYACRAQGSNSGKPEYSAGKCGCKSHWWSCPENTNCIDTLRGPYCECKAGYTLTAEGECAGASTTRTPDAIQCGPHDCRPGFCASKNGRIRCDCVSGYVAQDVDEIRQQCVLLHQ